MDAVKEYEEIYADNVDGVTNLLSKLDLNDPSKSVIEKQESLSLMLEQFIRAQSATTSSLIKFVGGQCTENKTINGEEMTPVQQRNILVDLANQSNLMSRQLEKNLHTHLNIQLGKETDTDIHLINELPMGDNFGTEQKISDSSLRLIAPFSGDDANNETNLTTFLREIYSVAQTNNLNEQTTVNVLIRKLTGSAQILIDNFVSQRDLQNLKLQEVVAHLEKKFIFIYSPLHADARLHEIKIDNLSFSQLEAQIQRLAKLATRLEPAEKREALTKVKENSAFLMAIGSSDRQLITTENARRSTEHLTPLNIDQMATFLSQRAADKMSYQELIFKAADSSSHAATPQQEEKIDIVAPQPPTRGRGQSRYRGGRGGYGNRNRGGNRGGFNGNGRQFRGSQQRRVFVTAEMAGVPEGACLLCGDHDHKFTDPKCKYKGKKLMPSPCRKCLRGAHPTATCLA